MATARVFFCSCLFLGEWDPFDAFCLLRVYATLEGMGMSRTEFTEIHRGESLTGLQDGMGRFYRNQPLPFVAMAVMRSRRSGRGEATHRRPVDNIRSPC